MKRIEIDDDPKDLQELIQEFEYDTIHLMKDGDTVAILRKDRGHPAELIGSMKDKIKINGDIMSTGAPWAVEDWKSYDQP